MENRVLIVHDYDAGLVTFKFDEKEKALDRAKKCVGGEFDNVSKTKASKLIDGDLKIFNEAGALKAMTLVGNANSTHRSVSIYLGSIGE